jgi:hypothetical protein
MWLLASQDEDAEAAWLAERLPELGLEQLEHVTASNLVHGAEWEHRVDARGTRTLVRLADGRTIDSGEVDAVLNRLSWITADGFAGASDADREYAAVEFQALVLSWLEGFGPAALNRPAPIGICAPPRAEAHWRWLAIEAGLAALAYEQDEVPGDEGAVATEDARHWVTVLDGKLVPRDGAVPDGPQPDAPALAAAVGLDLFEAGYERGSDGAWELCAINPLPSFFVAGDAAVEALVEALRRRGRSRR